MKAFIGWGLVCVALVACRGPENDESRVGRLRLQAGQSIHQAPKCGVAGPACPAGTGCYVLHLAEGSMEPRCLDDTSVCSELTSCSGNTQCAIMKSYPAQVTCTGSCHGTDCDDAVSNDGPSSVAPPAT